MMAILAHPTSSCTSTKTCRRKVRCIIDSFQTQQNRQWFTEDTFLSLLRLRGIESAAPGGYAEAFFCRKAVFTLLIR